MHVSLAQEKVDREGKSAYKGGNRDAGQEVASNTLTVN